MNIKLDGYGIAGIVTLVFIILKLTHVISWGWVYVLLPALIVAGLCLAGIILALPLAALYMGYLKIAKKIKGVK